MGISLRALGPNSVPMRTDALSAAATHALHKLVNVEPSTAVRIRIRGDKDEYIDAMMLDSVHCYDLPDFNWGGVFSYGDWEPDTGFCVSMDKVSPDKPTIFLVELSILCGATFIMGGNMICDFSGAVCLGRDYVETDKLYSLRSQMFPSFELAAQNFIRHLPLKLG